MLLPSLLGLRACGFSAVGGCVAFSASCSGLSSHASRSHRVLRFNSGVSSHVRVQTHLRGSLASRLQITGMQQSLSGRFKKSMRLMSQRDACAGTFRLLSSAFLATAVMAIWPRSGTAALKNSLVCHLTKFSRRLSALERTLPNHSTQKQLTMHSSVGGLRYGRETFTAASCEKAA